MVGLVVGGMVESLEVTRVGSVMEVRIWDSWVWVV